jgi:RIO kinase 1
MSRGETVKGDSLQERFDREIDRMGVRIKDADQMKVMENVFDDVTLLALYRMVHKRHLTAIGGSISTGKEANVFYGEQDDRPVAIKIYRLQSANFTTMSEYLTGDPRFSSIGRSRKAVIFAWTKKEYSNLMRAKEAGLPVPEPIFFDRNILLMEFLGEDEVPYPQLKYVAMEDAGAVYRQILAFIKDLYNRANLVHADLSEFNILYDGTRAIVIDMGQAVTPDHPRALAFLQRDIRNINRFFGKYTGIRDEKEIFTEVVGEERFRL